MEVRPIVALHLCIISTLSWKHQDECFYRTVLRTIYLTQPYYILWYHYYKSHHWWVNNAYLIYDVTNQGSAIHIGTASYGDDFFVVTSVVISSSKPRYVWLVMYEQWHTSSIIDTERKGKFIGYCWPLFNYLHDCLKVNELAKCMEASFSIDIDPTLFRDVCLKKKRLRLQLVRICALLPHCRLLSSVSHCFVSFPVFVCYHYFAAIWPHHCQQRQ